MICASYLFEEVTEELLSRAVKVDPTLFEPEPTILSNIGRLAARKNETISPKHGVKVVKDVLKKYADREHLKKLTGGVRYITDKGHGYSGAYESGIPGLKSKFIEIPHGRMKDEQELRAAVAHELSHSYDADLDKLNWRYIVSGRRAPFSDDRVAYFGRPEEFVARGGASHVDYLENPHYVASGSPTLKEHVQNLRKVSKQLTPEQRAVAHHSDSDSLENARTILNLTPILTRSVNLTKGQLEYHPIWWYGRKFQKK